MSDTTKTSTIVSDIELALPFLLQLLKSFAGNIYTKLTGTVGEIETFTSQHPDVIQAGESIAGSVALAYPGAAVVITPLLAAVGVAGEIGALIAKDTTVPGPQPAAPTTVQVATGLMSIASSIASTVESVKLPTLTSFGEASAPIDGTVAHTE